MLGIIKKPNNPIFMIFRIFENFSDFFSKTRRRKSSKLNVPNWFFRKRILHFFDHATFFLIYTIPKLWTVLISIWVRRFLFEEKTNIQAVVLKTAENGRKCHCTCPNDINVTSYHFLQCLTVTSLVTSFGSTEPVCVCIRWNILKVSWHIPW